MATSTVSKPRNSTDNGALVDVDQLSVHFGGVTALRAVSLRLEPGELVGVVGASGSGKTSLGRALLHLLPEASLTARRCRVAGVDVLSAGKETLRRLRGGAVGLVLQDPLASFDPLQRVGAALSECIRAHQRLPRAQLRERVLSLLTEVDLPDPAALARRYPHELSGGQRQRVGIATALANHPQLVIADEPTSSLDPPLAQQVAGLLRRRCHERGVALLLISHDLMLVSAVCDRFLVLEAGEVVEAGTVDAITHGATNPATLALLHAAGLAPSSPAAGHGEQL